MPCLHHARAHRAARPHRRRLPWRCSSRRPCMVYVERKVAALHAAALRPDPRRPAGPAAAVRRRHQADVQGGAAAEGGRRAPLLLAPIISATAAFAAFAVVPFGADDDVLRPARRADAAAGRRRQRRRPRDLRDHLDGRLRHRARRLELEQQVLAARRPALVGADDQLRAVVRPGARRGAHAGRLAVAARDRRSRRRATGSGSSRSGTSSCSRSASSSS